MTRRKSGDLGPAQSNADKLTAALNGTQWRRCSDLTSLQCNDVDPAPPASGDVPLSFSGTKVDVGGRVCDATKVAC